MVKSLKLVETPEDEIFAPFKYLLQKTGIDNSVINRAEIGEIWKTNEDVFIRLNHPKREINLRDCKKIEIRFEGYLGESLFQLVQPRWRVSLGDRNKLKLKIRNELLDFYILLKSRDERNTLKMILEFCYENTLQVKEYYRGKRTFKWKKVDFKSIQEIKKRYDLIEW